MAYNFDSSIWVHINYSHGMFLLVLFQRDKFSKRSILGVNEFKINYWAWSQIIKNYSMRYSFYQMQIHTVTYCMLHTVPYYFEKNSSGVKSRQYCEIESKISMGPIMETFLILFILIHFTKISKTAFLSA